MSDTARGVSVGALTATDTIGVDAGIDAQNDRLVDLARQLAANRRDLAADILRRVQRRHADVELDDDAREAFLRRRLDVAHAFDGVDRLFDELRHVALDRLRRRARVAGRHGDDRELDVGKQVDLQRLIRREAEHGQRRHHHRGEHRLLDGEIAQKHGLGPRFGRALVSTCTCVPGPSALGGSTTTTSPAFSPLVT